MKERREGEGKKVEIKHEQTDWRINVCLVFDENFKDVFIEDIG